MARQGAFELQSAKVISYQASSPVSAEIPVSGRVRGFWVYLTGSVTVTTIGTGVAVAKNPFSVVPNITFRLNGRKTFKSGQLYDWYVRNGVFYKLPTKVSDTAADNTTVVIGRVYIPCSMPGMQNPNATILDMNMWQSLEVEVTWGTVASIISGATTIAWAVEPTLTIYPDVDADAKPDPTGLFVEIARDSEALGTAASVANELTGGLTRGRGSNYHSLIVMGEDDPGTGAGRTPIAYATTALTNLTVEEVGPGGRTQRVSLDGDQLAYEYDTRRISPNGPQAGIYPVMFGPRSGLLRDVLETASLSELILRISQAGFATAGYRRVLQQIYEPF